MLQPLASAKAKLHHKPSYNKVLESSLCSLPPAKAGGSHHNTCGLYGNHWIYEKRWVGPAGPPKYSTPWLVWTPINFLFGTLEYLPLLVVSSDVFDLFKILDDGEASHGDGTNFCHASRLGCVGVMISLFKDFKSGLGDISDNWLQTKK